jgi:hypothetical protein
MYDMWTDWYVPDDPNDDKLLHRYDYNNFYASKTHKSVK